jgi:predicted PolB exonuclease-like 3'-5' exonuclease
MMVPIPDLEGYARANNLTNRSPDEIRTAMGDDFPKLIYHSIVCIGALVASRTANGYEVQVVGAPHIGQRTEKELIESFVNKITQLSPQLVTFNGGSFDLPVIRYRAMIHGVFAPGITTGRTSIVTLTTMSTYATCFRRSATAGRSS